MLVTGDEDEDEEDDDDGENDNGEGGGPRRSRKKSKLIIVVYCVAVYCDISITNSDRTDLSTESGSAPIQLARDRYRAARRSVADSRRIV